MKGALPLRLLVPAAWGVSIIGLSLVPNPPGEVNVPGMDKLLHAGAYALMAWLMSWALHGNGRFQRKACSIAFVTTIILGACLELLQGMMQLGRTAEWGDLVADGLGALIACVLFRLAVMLNWPRCLVKG